MQSFDYLGYHNNDLTASPQAHEVCFSKSSNHSSNKSWKSTDCVCHLSMSGRLRFWILVETHVSGNEQCCDIRVFAKMPLIQDSSLSKGSNRKESMCRQCFKKIWEKRNKRIYDYYHFPILFIKFLYPNFLSSIVTMLLCIGKK